MLYAATGVDAISAGSTDRSTRNHRGPGRGSVEAHFRDLNDAAIWVSCLAMIPGRLEAFPEIIRLLARFSPQFWRE